MSSRGSGPKNIAAVDSVDRLRTALARLGRQMRLTHVDDNLSPTQIEVLATVVRRGPIRLSTLATDEGINPTMLSRIVAKLETAELVTRIQDHADARIIHVLATASGDALLREIRNERTSAMRFGYSQLDDDQRAAIDNALDALEAVAEILKNRNA